MRARAEILQDGIKNSQNAVSVPEFQDKLSLLTLEVLIDVRDELAALITILGSVEKVAYRAG